MARVLHVAGVHHEGTPRRSDRPLSLLAASACAFLFLLTASAAQRGVVEGVIRNVDLENGLLTVRIAQPPRATRGELEVRFPIGPETRVYLREAAEITPGRLSDLRAGRFVFVEYEYDDAPTRTLRVIAH